MTAERAHRPDSWQVLRWVVLSLCCSLELSLLLLPLPISPLLLLLLLLLSLHFLHHLLHSQGLSLIFSMHLTLNLFLKLLDCEVDIVSKLVLYVFDVLPEILESMVSNQRLTFQQIKVELFDINLMNLIR